jgi:RND family efflux transporter MFP subunit
MTASVQDLSRLRINRGASDSGHPRAGRRVLGWWLLIAIALLGIAAWVALRPRALGVTVASASVTGGAGSATGDGITANGYVVARTKASVSAKVAGQLEYLGVHEGSKVRHGQVLARIESAAYAAALDAARAEAARAEVELAQGRRELERARALRDQSLISAVDLENASTRVDMLTAQVHSARAQADLAAVNLENTRVRAPFDGTVLRKDAELGEIVAPASAGGGLTRTAIVTMADLGSLEVEVDVNEAYIAQIRGGQDVGITLDAYPDTSFRGRVRQVVPTADRQKATVQVKVAILDRDPRILPEMGAKVVFLTASGRAAAVTAPRRVLVPMSAVVQDAAGARVWVVAGGRVETHPIELGRARGESYEVERGLSGGERVVLKPSAALKQGLRVRVTGS